jgi:hypothetical protein
MTDIYPSVGLAAVGASRISTWFARIAESPEPLGRQEVKKISTHQRPGLGQYCLRLETTLDKEVRLLAKRRSTTVRTVIEEALRTELLTDAAGRTDGELAPLIDRLLLDRHRRLEGGLRSMIARVAYEVLRTQYILLHFIVTAGVAEARVDKWREDGWLFAVREFKNQPKTEVEREEEDRQS